MAILEQLTSWFISAAALYAALQILYVALIIFCVYLLIRAFR